ncbi:MAG TPA: glycerophosphodiester phosphodiesterase family protein [Candidatus Limnocylindrales bacterium]|nr:glycerophosphodiester phosphodiesterase family protein [Candidatus Limnocylindrales bacterium]
MTRREGSAPRRSPLVIAHRGQRASFPEQTLEAYEAAIRLGAEAIETDVQRTRDGRLAMMHDLTLDRTTNGRGPIADLDWAAVRALDAGSWFGAGFGGCRVPSLDETIDLVVGAGCGLCVEIKGSAADAPTTATAVARLLRERAVLDRVYVSSFDHLALAAARAEVDGLLLAPERLPEAGPSDPPAAAAQAVALGAAALQHRWEDLTPDVVDAVHAVGTAVWAWPIDTLESIRHSVAVGADAIIGDDVVLLVAGLRGSVPPATSVPS